MQPTRLFVNRILQFMRSLPATCRASLDAGFYKDINWFCQFFDTYNGITKIHCSNQESLNFYVDASMTAIGAFFNNRVYHASIPPAYTGILSIVHYEMVNVMVAFRTWGSSWENKKILVHYDNKAVVNVLSNGHSRDPFLSACVHTLWLIYATFNIQVSVQHISGVSNVYADTLSRWMHFQHVNNCVTRFLKLCDWCSIDVSMLQPDFSV